MIINNTKLKSTADDLETYQLSNIGQKSFKSNIEKVNDDFFNCNLILTDNKKFIIPMRKDGYINVTLLCKVSGKDIRKWKENKSSSELLNTFFSLTGTPVSELLTSSRVGKTQYTFAHPDIAMQIAQWCNPYFALQVSRWTRELLLFGKVELGKEKSNQELENKYQERILTLEREYDKLRQLHNSLKFKRNYHELEQGDLTYLKYYHLYINK